MALTISPMFLARAADGSYSLDLSLIPVQAWQPLLLAAGWTPAVAPNTPPAYYIDPFGTVHYQGQVFAGAGAGPVIAPLPPNATPDLNKYFRVAVITGASSVPQIAAIPGTGLEYQGPAAEIPGLGLSLDQLDYRP